MNDERIVIVAYKALPGKEEELRALMKTHVEILKKEEFGCELSFLLKQRLEEALGGPEDGRKAPPTMEE